MSQTTLSSPLDLGLHLLAAVEKVHGGLGARLQEVHDHILLQQLNAEVRCRARVVLELHRNGGISFLYPYDAAIFISAKDITVWYEERRRQVHATLYKVFQLLPNRQELLLPCTSLMVTPFLLGLSIHVTD